LNTVLTDDRVQLAYQVEGADNAPPLLFLNSLGTNLRMWEPQVAALVGDFRIIRSDIRGHGLSAVPPGPYSVDRLGLDVLALLDALLIDRAHICGLSLGGLIALWLAARYPERVRSAIFANTGARIGTREGWNARIAAVQAGGMAAVREMVLARFFSTGFRAAHPDVVAGVGAMLDTTDPAGYSAACAAVRDAHLKPLIPGISVPALIITGALDVSTRPLQSEELHGAIQGSKLVVFHEAAHLSNLEQPAMFTSAVRRFLAEQETG
jgi:3-oxoadipate enol-lactonase